MFLNYPRQIEKIFFHNVKLSNDFSLTKPEKRLHHLRRILANKSAPKLPYREKHTKWALNKTRQRQEATAATSSTESSRQVRLYVTPSATRRQGHIRLMLYTSKLGLYCSCSTWAFSWLCPLYTQWRCIWRNRAACLDGFQLTLHGTRKEQGRCGGKITGRHKSMRMWR